MSILVNNTCNHQRSPQKQNQWQIFPRKKIITYNTTYFIWVSVGQKPLNWVLCGQLSQRCHRLFKRRLKWGRTLPPSPNCLLAGLVSSWIVGRRVSVPHKLLVTGFLQFLAMRVTTLFIPSEQEEPESFSNTEFSLFFFTWAPKRQLITLVYSIRLKPFTKVQHLLGRWEGIRQSECQETGITGSHVRSFLSYPQCLKKNSNQNFYSQNIR